MIKKLFMDNIEYFKYKNQINTLKNLVYTKFMKVEFEIFYCQT